MIGIKKGKKVRYVYNHSDSYPSGLMNDIYEQLKKCVTDEDFKMLELKLKRGEYEKEIDYLYHQYVYILDFKKKKWEGFRTLEHPKKNILGLHRYGKLIPLIEELDFNDHIYFYRNEENFECVTKVESMEDKINYKIIFDGKKYILIDKDDKLIGTGRNKKKLIVESVAESL